MTLFFLNLLKVLAIAAAYVVGGVVLIEAACLFRSALRTLWLVAVFFVAWFLVCLDEKLNGRFEQ